MALYKCVYYYYYYYYYLAHEHIACRQLKIKQEMTKLLLVCLGRLPTACSLTNCRLLFRCLAGSVWSKTWRKVVNVGDTMTVIQRQQLRRCTTCRSAYCNKRSAVAEKAPCIRVAVRIQYGDRVSRAGLRPVCDRHSNPDLL